MRILVIGCGSIGQRHIRLLRAMGEVAIGCDTDETALAASGEGYSDMMRALEAGDWNGIIIATPPQIHWEQARLCLQANVPTLVEKPMALTSWTAQDLVACSKPIPLQVGYCLRFHPGLRNLKQLLDAGTVGRPLCARIWCGSYLPDWRPDVDYRTGYAARAEQGGGVLWDCSHELDYACWLFGEPVCVTCITARTGTLEIETEDVADLTIRFASGVQASIHLSYVDRHPARGAIVTCANGSVEWDFDQYSVFAWQQFPDKDVRHLRATHFADEMGTFQAAGRTVPWLCQPDDLYRAELQHFLAICRGAATPSCTAQDGLRAVKLVLAAHESDTTGTAILTA